LPTSHCLDCGIRPATVAEAEWLQDFVRRTTNHSAIAASSRRGAAAAAARNNGPSSDDEDEDESEASSGAEISGPEPSFTFNQPTGLLGEHSFSFSLYIWSQPFLPV
jgi:hypothetical protein